MVISIQFDRASAISSHFFNAAFERVGDVGASIDPFHFLRWRYQWHRHPLEPLELNLIKFDWISLWIKCEGESEREKWMLLNVKMHKKASWLTWIRYDANIFVLLSATSLFNSAAAKKPINRSSRADCFVSSSSENRPRSLYVKIGSATTLLNFNSDAID